MKHSNEFIALVIRSQNGDLEAFESLVARFQDMAVGYAYSILNDFGLAQDAAQEAFIQAYSDLSKLREPAAFPSWFRRIVFKYCDRFVRGKRAEAVPWETMAMTATSEAGPAEIAESRETVAGIYQALHALPDDKRAVMGDGIVLLPGRFLERNGSVLGDIGGRRRSPPAFGPNPS
jgi:RNA polymerase sigma factor (sigma-70 family)